MFGSDILEVAIGVVFVFVLVSTVCAAIREGIEAWLKTRAAYLEFGIRELLFDKNGNELARQLYEHPLILSLFSGGYEPRAAGNKPPKRGGNLPSYIPSRNFAAALVDIVARGPGAPAQAQRASALSVRELRDAIARNPKLSVGPALLAILDMAGDDLDRARMSIEAWYDSAMDRVSGWYKRLTYWFIFWIALGTAVALNVNTLAIIDYLYRHGPERSALIATIEKAPVRADGKASYESAMAGLDALRLPIGWDRPSQGSVAADKSASKLWLPSPSDVLGWLLTAIAATLGAPFWFDVLNKIMVIRSTVKPHEKSPEEGSEDRQPPYPAAAGRGQPPVDSGPRPNAPSAAEILLSANTADAQCGVGDVVGTPDELLPAAEGGVS